MWVRNQKNYEETRTRLSFNTKTESVFLLQKTKNEDEQKQKENIIEVINSKYFICQFRQKSRNLCWNFFVNCNVYLETFL